MKAATKTTSLFLILVTFLPVKIVAQDEDDGSPYALYGFLLGVAYYALVGRYSDEEHLHNEVARYPYQNKMTGNYIASDDTANTQRFGVDAKAGIMFVDTRRFRVDAENRIMFSGNDIYGNHLRMKLRPFRYFYLQSNVFGIIEFSRSKNYPSFSVLDFSFCYDRLRFRKFNLGWMIGMNYVESRVRRAGFSGGFNADCFVVAPVSIHGSVNWGANVLGTVNHIELTGRYHRKKMFVSAGYETLKAVGLRHHFAAAGFGVYL